MTALDDFVIENGVLKKYIGYGSDENVVIPDEVTVIGPGAFQNQRGIRTVTMSNCVKEIKDSAFFSCSNLASVRLSENLELIEPHAFSYCTSLTELRLPEALTSLSPVSFYGCRNLKELALPDQLRTVGTYTRTEQEKILRRENGVVYVGGHVISVEDTPKIVFRADTTGMEPGVFDYCRSITTVRLDGTLKEIPAKALCSCENLQEISLPDSIEKIGAGAFYGLEKLSAITLPKALQFIGERAFEWCTSLTEIMVPDGVSEIGKRAFAHCESLKQFTCGPDVKLRRDIFGDPLPAQLVQNVGTYMPQMQDGLVKEILQKYRGWTLLNQDEKIELLLERQSKTLTPAFRSVVSNAAQYVPMLLERLQNAPTDKHCRAIADFTLCFQSYLKETDLHLIHETLLKLPTAQKALDMMMENAMLRKKLGESLKVDPKRPKVEQDLLKCLDDQGKNETTVHEKCRDCYGSVSLPRMQYKDGTLADPMLLEWLLTSRETYFKFGKHPDMVFSTCKTQLTAMEAEVIEELDDAVFRSALQNLADCHLSSAGRSKEMYLAYPICRYLDEAGMEDLTKRAATWTSRSMGVDAPALKVFRKACRSSNTKAAMFFAEQFHDLEEYASARNMDEETFRDRYLVDCGFDEEGCKQYDLGNQTITAVLQPDQTLFLLKADGKLAKTMPKKGADPEKYEKVNEDFKETKKYLKKIIKNRIAQLRENFFTRNARDGDAWEISYMKNPILSNIAKTVVWTQNASTFTVIDQGLITADGTPYVCTNDPVLVAHPMEMEPEDIAAWQKYFTHHRLKQPFAQVWEPVMDPETIREDRYAGFAIPYYRFLHQEKNGVHVLDEDFHNEITIYFDGCRANVERTEWKRHEIDPGDTFVIEKFFMEAHTYKANHVVAYLDRITVYPMIEQDDPKVVERLSGFTLAQITEFLTFANEKGSTNAAAAILNYKNEHFADFDPMDEFTLE